jgi:hypothetical protein
MKKGKEPMRTFGDLMQFFETKTDDKKPPAAKKKEQGEKHGPAPVDSPAPEATADAAKPADGNVADTNVASPPPAVPSAPEPAEAVAPVSGGPSPEPPTPPAAEGQQV